MIEAVAKGCSETAMVPSIAGIEGLVTWIVRRVGLVLVW
jgi:hypothetical protein